MTDEKRSRLGRGLAALIGDVDEPVQVEAIRAQKKVPIEFLKPNPSNPRKNFLPDELDDLAQSIKEKGIIQPILVRALRGVADVYEIIAGERRWRAAQQVGIHEVPVNVVEVSDREALELAIIENVQRADLNAFEEAAGYQKLMDDFDYTQNDLSKIIGKSRSHVANTLRLLKLPDLTRQMLIDGRLSAGHARALIGVDDPDSLAQKVVALGLSVRDLEKLVQSPEKTDERKKTVINTKDADTLALEKILTDLLGLKVTIKNVGERGEIKIEYKTLDQLDGFCKRIH
jgi:ParB family transcriptional regulator, chromosome partitioning protein